MKVQPEDEKQNAAANSSADTSNDEQEAQPRLLARGTEPKGEYILFNFCSTVCLAKKLINNKKVPGFFSQHSFFQ